MGGDRRYADLNEIYEDLEHAAEIQKRLRCPVIDVSEHLDRGDRAPDHPNGRAAHAHRPERPVKPKPPVSKARWALWCFLLAVAMFTFYVLFTPFWFALRSLAWLAEYRARRRR